MPSTVHPFRVIEPFLDGFLRTEALTAAFELGVIEGLARSPLPVEALARALSVDAQHLHTLIGLLVQHGVLRRDGETLALSEGFREALEYRDLLAARIDFAHRVRRAMLDYFALSIRDPLQYQQKLVDFYQFDTRRDYPEDVAVRTRAWVRHMSTYTRYCAPVLLARHDFSRYRYVLDVGGNNGELATQLCRKHADVQVTILDIPAVCDIGVEHVRAAGLSERITFLKGDARRVPFPTGFDAVLFSSVLHDHDAATIATFLDKAHGALAPGGDIILFETYAFDFQREIFAEHHVELVPFLSYYGPPDRYVQELSRLGFAGIRTEAVEDIRFLLTTARRPNAKAKPVEDRLAAIVDSVEGRHVDANSSELWFELESAGGLQIRLSGDRAARAYDRSANFAISYSGQLSDERIASTFRAVVERIKAVDQSPIGGVATAFRSAADAVARRCAASRGEYIASRDDPEPASIALRPTVAATSTPNREARGQAGTTDAGATADDGHIKTHSEIFLDFCAQLYGNPGQALLPMHWGFWPTDAPASPTSADAYGAWGAFSENLLAYIPEGVSRILDVGCGLGYNAQLLSQRGKRVTAVSPVAHHVAVIERARLPGVDAKCGRFEELLPDRRYDLLLFSESVNHFSLREEFWEHCKQFLTDSGFMLMADDLTEERARMIETQRVFRIIRAVDITANVAPSVEWWAKQLPMFAAYHTALMSILKLDDPELAARVRSTIDAVDDSELKLLLSGETKPPAPKGRYMIYLLQLA